MKRIGLFILILSLFACRSAEISQLIGNKQEVALQKVDFVDLQGFEEDHAAELIPAFQQSCAAVKKNPAILQNAALKLPKSAYLDICQRFENEKPSSDAQMLAFIEANFDPYLVWGKGTTSGKFTSYYEAEIEAAKTRHGAYQYPIYGKPHDMFEFNPADFDKNLPSRRLLGRVQKNKIVPYYTRAEIDQRNLDAPVVLWGNDPVDIFLMQIQGSAVATLDDGQQVRIRYVDNNGHPFVGIGSILLKKKLLPAGQGSMDKIRDWLKQHPELAQKNMAENPRYVFHDLSDAEGPIGALGVPLTAGRSLAVDKTYVPLGALLWLDTTAPDQKPLRKTVAAQDVGGAIKGVIRGDYFWGHGESALLNAGKMNASGKYYILWPKGSKPVVHD